MSPWSGLDGSASALASGTTQLAFLVLFTTAILLIPRHATVPRVMSLVALSALTFMLQVTFLSWCRHPFWRTTVGLFAWIQFMSASEMIWVSRVDFTHISGEFKAETVTAQATQAIALLWNLRRVGTRWQVKNIPASPRRGLASWVLERLTMTFLAYLVLDLMVTRPSPDLALVGPQKETLFRFGRLSLEDLVFRIIGTLSFWLSIAIINLVLVNSPTIVLVLTGMSSPTDCPPLYGPIREAYSLRRFWG
jgi:hypothetical protein